MLRFSQRPVLVALASVLATPAIGSAQVIFDTFGTPPLTGESLYFDWGQSFLVGSTAARFDQVTLHLGVPEDSRKGQLFVSLRSNTSALLPGAVLEDLMAPVRTWAALRRSYRQLGRSSSH